MSKKRFCYLQILIVAMMVVGLLANTYAWSDRGAQSGSKLSLNYESVVNGCTATAQTYRVVDGVEELVESNAAFQVSDGDVLTFKTVVTNTESGAVLSNVSLLLKEVTFVSTFTVRVSAPTHEFREYSGGVVSDWVRVVPSCEVGAGETQTFEWAIEITGSGELTIGEIVLENF